MTLLPPLALEALLESGVLRPAEGSLLRRYAPPFLGDPVARAAAGVLLQRSMVLLEAASLLASATAVLEVTEVKRGAAPFTARSYVRGTRLCTAVSRPEGIEVESPVAVKHVVDRLISRLSGVVGPAMAMLPSEAQIIAQLWPNEGKPLTQAQTRAQCVATLERLGAEPDGAAQAFEALTASRALVTKGREVRVSKPLGQALEALWSGQVLELRGGSLDGARSTTLVFVGPKGGCYQLERVPAATWTRQVGAKLSEEDMLVFHGHARAELQRRLTMLAAP